MNYSEFPTGPIGDSSDMCVDPNAALDRLLSTPTNQEKIAGILRQEFPNLKNHQIAAILGNLQQESRFNPNSFNDQGGGKGALGIAQWRSGRQDALLQFAKDSGTSPYDVETQTRFLANELRTTERPALQALEKATTTQEASVAWASKFERFEDSGNPQGEDNLRRIQNSESLNDQIEKGTLRNYEAPAPACMVPDSQQAPSFRQAIPLTDSNKGTDDFFHDTKVRFAEAYDSAKQKAGELFDKASETIMPSAHAEEMSVMPKGQSTSLLGPEFSGSTPEPPSPVIDPKNPLGITDTEGKSVGQRLGLGEGQYLGKPAPEGDGTYIYPIYNEKGDVTGGLQMGRNSDGSLTGTYANQMPHLDGKGEWDRPNIETKYLGGTQKEKDLLEHKSEGGSSDDKESSGNKWEDAGGFKGVEAGAGGKLSGSANLFDGSTGTFTVNPDGSGYGGKITNKAGEVGGVFQGDVKGGYEDGKGSAKGEFEAGVEGKVASGGLSGEKYWSIIVKPDGTCQQTSVGAQGEAFIGGAAKYTGSYGTGGLSSKVSLGFGPGLSAGGNLNYDKNFECSNPFANPGVKPEGEGAGGAEGKSITAIEHEAESFAQNAENNAKRAESAAARAEAAAQRAAAAAARLRAMISGV